MDSGLGFDTGSAVYHSGRGWHALAIVTRVPRRDRAGHGLPSPARRPGPGEVVKPGGLNSHVRILHCNSSLSSRPGLSTRRGGPEGVTA